MEKAIAFGFQASNNEAKYEALVIGLQLAKLCGASVLKAHCDSQLVVSQARGEFDVKKSKYEGLPFNCTKARSGLSRIRLDKDCRLGKYLS